MSLDYLTLIETRPDIFDNSSAPLKVVLDPIRITAFREDYKKELAHKGLPLGWADLGVLLHDPYIVVLRDLVQFPSGGLRPYVRLINTADLEGGQGVVVFPQMKGKILLLRQFRHATRSWHLEVPRGFGTPGTPPEEQARREIGEEVGGEIERLIDLGLVHSNTGLEAHAVRMFLCQLKSVGAPQEDEGIERLQWVSTKQLEQSIRDGTISDGFTIAAYTRAMLRGLIPV